MYKATKSSRMLGQELVGQTHCQRQIAMGPKQIHRLAQKEAGVDQEQPLQRPLAEAAVPVQVEQDALKMGDLKKFPTIFEFFYSDNF
jgi:hypothetical protein